MRPGRLDVVVLVFVVGTQWVACPCHSRRRESPRDVIPTSLMHDWVCACGFPVPLKLPPVTLFSFSHSHALGGQGKISVIPVHCHPEALSPVTCKSANNADSNENHKGPSLRSRDAAL